jgi:hypothetical protein
VGIAGKLTRLETAIQIRPNIHALIVLNIIIFQNIQKIYETNHSSYDKSCPSLSNIKKIITSRIMTISYNSINTSVTENLNINCLQINLQRSKAATAHLNQQIVDKKYDIVFIQEPYVIKSRVCGFPISYKLFYKESETIKTTICVTNKKINVLFIESFSNQYSTAVKFEFMDKTLFGFSLYCSPLQRIETELNHIKEVILVLKPEYLIICTDSNAKSKVWFNNRDDDRGNQLIQFLSELNLIVLNDDPNSPTFQTNRGQSFIDLTIIGVNCSQIVNNWKVCEEESLSDHKYTEFKIEDSPQAIHYKNTKKYFIKDENWPKCEFHCFVQISEDPLRPLPPNEMRVRKELSSLVFV